MSTPVYLLAFFNCLYSGLATLRAIMSLHVAPPKWDVIDSSLAKGDSQSQGVSYLLCITSKYAYDV